MPIVPSETIILSRRGDEVMVEGPWPEIVDFDCKALLRTQMFPTPFMIVTDYKAILTLSNGSAEYKLDPQMPGITIRRGYLLPGSTIDEAIK